MAEQKIGKVIHYYDKIAVAIVALDKPIKKSDALKFRHGEQEFDQTVGSLQIQHQDVDEAKKGTEVGIKIDQPVKEGTEVFLVSA